MEPISTAAPSYAVPEFSDRSCRAEYWWRRLIRIGFSDEQLDRLRNEIRQHGLSPTEFYELLEVRGAPAAVTFRSDRGMAS